MRSLSVGDFVFLLLALRWTVLLSVFGFVGASHFSPLDKGAHLTEAGAELLFDTMARLPHLVAARAARADALGAD